LWQVTLELAKESSHKVTAISLSEDTKNIACLVFGKQEFSSSIVTLGTSTNPPSINGRVFFENSYGNVNWYNANPINNGGIKFIDNTNLVASFGANLRIYGGLVSFILVMDIENMDNAKYL
jgi:hypothetical protein